jgi:N6-adenosine-specific RNA methylase IME4
VSLPPGPYDIIYADPPWFFSGGIRSSKKDENGSYRFYTPDTTVGLRYDTQGEGWIASLPVASIAAADAVLFMWTTDAHLPVALRIIEAWDFTYKTVGFVWNKKERSGKQVCYYGKWTMKGTELCLLATRGKPHRFLVSHKVRQLVEAERGGHSQKPDEVRRRIVELLGDRPRIELFARETAPGWDAWGDGVETT